MHGYDPAYGPPPPPLDPFPGHPPPPHHEMMPPMIPPFSSHDPGPYPDHPHLTTLDHSADHPGEEFADFTETEPCHQIVEGKV